MTHIVCAACVFCLNLNKATYAYVHVVWRVLMKYMPNILYTTHRNTHAHHPGRQGV